MDEEFHFFWFPREEDMIEFIDANRKKKRFSVITAIKVLSYEKIDWKQKLGLTIDWKKYKEEETAKRMKKILEEEIPIDIQ
jgi:hypothetical protein